jgi:hypothetical protein
MNVFEENESLRQEVAGLRADLAAAEARLQQLHALRLAALTDDEAKQILGHRLRVPEERQVHQAVTRERRHGRRDARRR